MAGHRGGQGVGLPAAEGLLALQRRLVGRRLGQAILAPRACSLQGPWWPLVMLVSGLVTIVTLLCQMLNRLWYFVGVGPCLGL